MTRDDFKVGQLVWFVDSNEVIQTEVLKVSKTKTLYDVIISHPHAGLDIHCKIIQDENYLYPMNRYRGGFLEKIFLTRKKAVSYFNQCIYQKIEQLQNKLIKQ